MFSLYTLKNCCTTYSAVYYDMHAHKILGSPMQRCVNPTQLTKPIVLLDVNLYNFALHTYVCMYLCMCINNPT